jgi:anaerobic ribonucleoside-triphosphate reductase activating protein
MSLATIMDSVTAEMDTGQVLNVASTISATRALGPGLRAVVWVQGCPFRCPGCISPESRPFEPARLVRVETLVSELLIDPDVTGFTYSGGEPMMQAAGLARLIRIARRRRELSLVCFTGFTLDELRADPPTAGVSDLLEEIDVLIDGRYVAELNDNRGLRGSHNQRVHFLTDCLEGHDFETEPRQAEIYIEAGQAVLIGVPPRGALAALQDGVRRAIRVARLQADPGDRPMPQEGGD